MKSVLIPPKKSLPTTGRQQQQPLNRQQPLNKLPPNNQPAPKSKPLTDEDYEYFRNILDLLNIDQVTQLVSTGAKRHAPISIVFVLSNLGAMLKQYKSVLSKASSNNQLNILQIGGSKKKPQKNNNKNNNKSDGNDKKKENDKFCSIMSVPYVGEASPSESLNKILQVFPWYEYALNVFRNETSIRVQLNNRSSSSEDTKILRESLIMLDVIKKNILILYIEKNKVMSKQYGPSYLSIIMPGFFLITDNSFKNNTPKLLIEARHDNEMQIQLALLNRKLEYGTRIPIDRILIIYHEYFRYLLSSTMNEYIETIPVSFSNFVYDIDLDEFFLLYDTHNVLIQFKLLHDGNEYPQPKNVNIVSLDYFQMDNNKLTLLQGDEYGNNELIQNWIMDDGYMLDNIGFKKSYFDQ